MKKDILELFINRYHLNNTVNKVKWKYTVADKTFHTRAMADNKAFVVDVVLNEFTELGDADVVLCVGDTEKVKKMLSPFGEDIAMAVNRTNDRILGFNIADANCESYCTCADPTSMDPVPKNLNEVDGYTAEIKITEEFVNCFVKARNALNDVETFTVSTNKKGQIEFVIGYPTPNSNRIRFVPVLVPGLEKLDCSLTYPVKNLFEVLKCNKSAEGTIKIHPNGTMKIATKDDRFTCTYYQFANKKA